jgi:ribosomal protein L37AE/L43A
MPVSRETHAKRYADILAAKDVQAWLLKQRMANWRYCSVCKGRVVRKKNATIECRKCGRWMTVADYEASLAAEAAATDGYTVQAPDEAQP